MSYYDDDTPPPPPPLAAGREGGFLAAAFISRGGSFILAIEDARGCQIGDTSDTGHSLPGRRSICQVL
jgi:hypothetical protein